MASTYTREDRYKAAASLFACSNSITASRETGIPASTIRHWSLNDIEFQEMCQEIKAEFGETIKNKLAVIVNEAADQALDRLRNGDFVRDSKTGDLARVPVKGRDAAIIGAVAFDKLRLAESQPTAIVRHEDTKERLERLAEQFREIARNAQNGKAAASPS